jgi:hypothetical protein
MVLLSQQATLPSRQMVASVVRGQRATRGVGLVRGMNGNPFLGMSIGWPNLEMILDRRVKCRETQSPSPKMVLYRYVNGCIPIGGMLNHLR